MKRMTDYVTFRAPAGTNEKLDRIAEAQQVKVSTLLREGIEHLISTGGRLKDARPDPVKQAEKVREAA